MKSRTVISYYAVICTIVVVKVIATIFQGSLVLYKNHQLSQLEKQYQSLEQQHVQLSQQLAISQSLILTRESNQIDQYQPVAPIGTLKLTTAVAISNL